MKNPREVVDQCDVLIAKHEEAIREVRRLRRRAMALIPIRRRVLRNAWGVEIEVIDRGEKTPGKEN